MNEDRRNAIKKAKLLLEESYNILNNVLDSEGEAMNNVPENLQFSNKYENMEQNVDALDDAISLIDDAINSISVIH